MTYLNGERTAKEGEEDANAPPGCDVMIFDLHSGDPHDYKLALNGKTSFEWSLCSHDQG